MICPECGKENKDGARGCAYCPEPFIYEDDPDYVKPKFKKFDPASWPIHYWLLLFVAGGFVIWRGLMGVLMLGEDGLKNPLKKFVDSRTRIVDNNDMLHKGMGVVLGTGTPTGLAEAHEMRMEIRGNGADPVGNPGDWRLNGRVLDLVTLAPVPEAELDFIGHGGHFAATTDLDGHYAVAVPPIEHGGYKVSIIKGGYAKTYLNPGADSVPQMSLEDRRGLAQDLNRADDGPYEVQPIGNDPLTTDFYVAPQ